MLEPVQKGYMVGSSPSSINLFYDKTRVSFEIISNGALLRQDNDYYYTGNASARSWLEKLVERVYRL